MKVWTIFILALVVNLVRSCNKRTIVLRGPKLWHSKDHQCQGLDCGAATSTTTSSSPSTTTITITTTATTNPNRGLLFDQTTPEVGSGQFKEQILIENTTNDAARKLDRSEISPECMKCGTGLSTIEDTGELNRPWMVHFSIELQNKYTIECSGSLISKRWIISAAHCFCQLTEVYQ